MKKRVTFKESGQSLVIFVILALVFLGMLALILDGGYGYFQRRLAQNAADAGALAGAEVLCEDKIFCVNKVDGVCLEGAEKVALDQAILENYAMEATADQLDQDGDGVLDEEDRLVQVETNITFDTFFGAILGRDAITAAADATAGCYPPLTLNGVMPVAWSCRKPVIDEDEENPWDSDDCQLLYTEDKYEPYDSQMYLIMDSDKIPVGLEYYHACQDPTWIFDDPPDPERPDPDLLDCDIDNDGVDDIITGGDRSWLNLTKETAGTNKLRDWIDQVETITLKKHVWSELIDGDKADVFSTLAEHVDEEFILPVYDQLCDVTSKAEPGNPNKLSVTQCYNDFTIPPEHDIDEIYRDIGGQHVHVINYVMFKVTCVSYPGHWDICPVKNAAVLADLANFNTLTVEGFFTRGNAVGAEGGPSEAPWMEVWKVYLID